jgi:hypothetical protein
MHALGQADPSKPGHAHVLHGDHLVLADQPKGELVVVIGPPVADLAVRGRDPYASLGAVGRPLALAGESPLELPLRGAAGYRVPAGRLLTRPVQPAVHMADRARVQPASAVAAPSDQQLVVQRLELERLQRVELAAALASAARPVEACPFYGFRGSLVGWCRRVILRPPTRSPTTGCASAIDH